MRYQEAHTPWDWHRPIFDRARELGLIAFSTPFDGRRPGYGLAPKYYESVLGRRVNCDLPKGTAFSWNHLG